MYIKKEINMGTFTEQWIDISEYEQYSTDIKFRAHTAPLVIFNGKYLSVDILLCHYLYHSAKISLWPDICFNTTVRTGNK